MKIKVAATWEWDKAEEKEFQTLDELLAYVKQLYKETRNLEGFILQYNEADDSWVGEIYDSYRE